MTTSDDELIRRLYSTATLEHGPAVRQRLLAQLRAHLRAGAAAWLTHGVTGLAGDFTCDPALAALTPAQLARAATDPGQLARVSKLLHVRVLTHAHADVRLLSIVALWWDRAEQLPDEPLLARLLAHTVSANALGQQLHVQRDEWLLSLGRSNRGCTALIDCSGAIHTASAQFRALLAEVYGAGEHERLPIDLPAEIGAACQFGDRQLRFRIEPHGRLYTLHVRRALPLDGLSPREQEIARALGDGKTFKSVAREKSIAVSTVANHASRIYRKLGIFRREDLVEIVRTPRSAGARVRR